MHCVSFSTLDKSKTNHAPEAVCLEKEPIPQITRSSTCKKWLTNADLWDHANVPSIGLSNVIAHPASLLQAHQIRFNIFNMLICSAEVTDSTGFAPDAGDSGIRLASAIHLTHIPRPAVSYQTSRLTAAAMKTYDCNICSILEQHSLLTFKEVRFQEFGGHFATTENKTLTVIFTS